MLSEEVKNKLDTLFLPYKTTNSSVDINELASDFSQILQDTSKNVLLTKKTTKKTCKQKHKVKEKVV